MEIEKRMQSAQDGALRCLGKEKEEEDRINKVFDQLRSLNGERKLIAHNTPMCHVYKRGVDEKVEFRLEMRSARNLEKSMTLQQIRKATENAKKNAEKLCDVFRMI